MRAHHLLLVVLLSSCGSSEDSPAATAASELTMGSPELTVEPGVEKMFCWYQTLPSEDDVWVTEFEGAQASGGHHVVAFTTIERQPDGTVQDCTNANDKMEKWRLVIAAPKGNHYALPAGYGLRIPGSTQLMFQSHYVNTTKAPLKVRDAIKFKRASDPSKLVPAAPFTSSVLKYSLAPKTATTIKYECQLDRPMNVFLAMGHMHEHGTAMRIEAGPASAPKEIYKIEAWEPEFRDKAPAAEWPLSAPLSLQKGDVYRVECTWNSNADVALKFPSEMCASLAFFYPSADPAVCVGTIVP